MITFTKGYELTTSLTNIVIFIVSLYSVLMIKNKKWKLFFILMSINSLLGTIVHGIELNSVLKDAIWNILSILFVFTINLFLSIFMNIKMKHFMYLSVITSIILIVLYYLDMNFLLVYTFYVLLIIILSFYKILKSKLNNKKYFIIGYIVQIIGGVLLLMRVHLNYLNYNGIYHLFMALTLVFFYLGVQVDKEKKE